MDGRNSYAERRQSSWIAPHRPNPLAPVRLYCFPHAGVGASIYRTWSVKLPEVEVCPVQLPGREARLAEPAVGDLERLADAVFEGLRPRLDGRPFALYGHSIGSVVAFEFIRRLRKAGDSLPCHLFVAARRAPHLPSRFPSIRKLPDADFIAALTQRYGGIPKEIARERDVMKLLLPCIRADVSANETYRYVKDVPLDCPITALAGVDDDSALPEEVEAWRAETTGPFTFALIPGDHFFLNTARPHVLRLVARALQDVHLPRQRAAR